MRYYADIPVAVVAMTAHVLRGRMVWFVVCRYHRSQLYHFENMIFGIILQTTLEACSTCFCNGFSKIVKYSLQRQSVYVDVRYYHKELCFAIAASIDELERRLGFSHTFVYFSALCDMGDVLIVGLFTKTYDPCAKHEVLWALIS